MSLADNIRRIRLGAGMTQHEFAQALGVNPMTVSKWERGVLRPSAGMKERMREIEGGGLVAGGEK